MNQKCSKDATFIETTCFINDLSQIDEILGSKRKSSNFSTE